MGSRVLTLNTSTFDFLHFWLVTCKWRSDRYASGVGAFDTDTVTLVCVFYLSLSTMQGVFEMLIHFHQVRKPQVCLG